MEELSVRFQMSESVAPDISRNISPCENTAGTLPGNSQRASGHETGRIQMSQDDKKCAIHVEDTNEDVKMERQRYITVQSSYLRTGLR